MEQSKIIDTMETYQGAAPLYLDVLWRGSVIRLRRIYNFLFFHANILQLSYTFGNFLYYFLGLTY